MLKDFAIGRFWWVGLVGQKIVLVFFWSGWSKNRFLANISRAGQEQVRSRTGAGGQQQEQDRGRSWAGAGQE